MKMIRGIITAITEGKIKLFSGTGRIGESFSKREFWQHYGFTSRPLKGAEAIILKDGNTVHIIASDDRKYRLAIEDGEVALYTDEGDYIHLKRGKEIGIKSGGKLIVDAPAVELGNGALNKLIDERFKTLFDAHKHLGVTTGSGTSGVPVDPLILADNATSIVKGS